MGAQLCGVIKLTEEYCAPSSLGTFNLQINLQVQNNQNEDWPSDSYKMVIMTLNSGVFVNERGTSSTFLSLLTKQDVLDALQQQPIL
ncbi:MAG: major capsid protein V20 domain-containing protein [Candidatus Fonsibacter sp.]